MARQSPSQASSRRTSWLPMPHLKEVLAWLDVRVELGGHRRAFARTCARDEEQQQQQHEDERRRRRSTSRGEQRRFAQVGEEYCRAIAAAVRSLSGACQFLGLLARGGVERSVVPVYDVWACGRHAIGIRIA